MHKRLLAGFHLLFSLFSLFCLSAYGEESSLATLRLFQTGLAPILAGESLRTSQASLHILGESVLEQLPSFSPSANCVRYATNLTALLQQIDRATGELENHDDTLDRARLMLLVPSLFSLHDLFSKNAEGGFGTLDQRQRQTCRADSGRREFAQAFDAYAKALARFHREAIGNPGIEGLEDLTDNLLRLADRNEIRRERLSWGVLLITTGTSILFWEIAPAAVAMAARTAFSATPRLLLQPVVVAGLRSGVLGAEGVGYYVFALKINPDAVESPALKLGSYAEQMAGLEQLLASPVNSPELYFVYLSAIKSQLVQLFTPWLNQHAGEFGAIP